MKQKMFLSMLGICMLLAAGCAGAEKEEVKAPEAESKQEMAAESEDAAEEASWEAFSQGMPDGYAYRGDIRDFEADLDGDGIPERFYRDYTEERCEMLLYFGNGDVLNLGEADQWNHVLTVEGMDLTGDGTNEIVVLGSFPRSTDPEAGGDFRIYAKTETGYEQGAVEVPVFEKLGEECPGVSLALSLDTAGGVLKAANPQYDFEESIALSQEALDMAESYGAELQGIFTYEAVEKDGRIFLQPVQNIGLKGPFGRLRYELSWEADGSFQIHDLQIVSADVEE